MATAADGGGCAVIAGGRRRRRKIHRFLGWGCAWLAAGLVLCCLADMVGTVLLRGLESFRWRMLWTPTSGSSGGLENALLGTLLLVAISVAIAAPLGILGGVYTAEFAGRRTARVIRFVAEILSGVPSIVIGYFAYLLLVQACGWGFSALAGGISLTVMMLPYILRSTEASLQQVPLTLREAAWGVGMTRFQTIRYVVVKPAMAGMATGVLLAVAIAMGETAPLLYTAGWSTMNPNLQLTHQPVGYLTYIVYKYIEMPFPDAHALAYSAALVLLMVVLLLNVAVRAVVGHASVLRFGRGRSPRSEDYRRAGGETWQIQRKRRRS
ncbi:MAG: phosphate ABC transporter permease PstA [Alicyclobacillus sp.]|nr:phosphate ABC transporter permease PstA [Alicyclobacillus sp.]